MEERNQSRASSSCEVSRSEIGSQTQGSPSHGGGQRRKKRANRYETSLSDIQDVFKYPFKEAAERLQLSVKTLRRRCRDFNILQWPYAVNLRSSAKSARSGMSSDTTTAPGVTGMSSGFGACVPGVRMGSEAKPWPHMSDLVEDHPPPPPQQQTRAASASASEEYRFPCAKSSKGLDIATTLLVEEAVKKFNACEQAVYEEKVRRRAARKARKVELVEWYKNATNAELHEKFKDFHEWLAVQDNTAEEVLKRTDDAIFLTTEVESRNYQLFKGGKRKEVSLTGDPLYDEHLPILSYHIGTILAEVIVNAHKTARLNMYSSNYLMCWFLAGYGFEGFDSSVEFNQGIEKLEGQIERGEVESLSVLGRLLRTQGLMPLPKEVRRAEGEGCDDPGGIKFKALMCRLLEENDEQMKKEVANRLDLGVRLLRDWAELEKTILEEMLLASRVFAIQKYHGMGTEELYNLFRDTMAECSKDGVTDLTETSAVDMMDLRSLAEELRLRYMSIGGYFNGDRLFDIEPEDLMVYVPILTANIGAKAAKVLLSSNSLKDYNVYVNTECMATWLLGLGFPKNHSKTFLGNVQEVQSKLDSGDLEPLWEFSMLLRDKDLPWPHSYFQASDDAGLS